MWTSRPCCRARSVELAQQVQFALPIAVGSGFGVAGGLDFHGSGTQHSRHLDLFCVRIDEQGNVDACLFELFHRLGHRILLRNHVEAAFRGKLLTAFGNQRRFVGFDGTGDIDNFVNRGHFQIQTVRDHLSQKMYVAILNVPTIFAQVNGDAVGAAQYGQNGGGHGIGQLSVPGLSKRGNVIDVYAKSDHTVFLAGCRQTRRDKRRSFAYFYPCRDCRPFDPRSLPMNPAMSDTTRRLSPQLQAVLEKLQPGQRLRITQLIRVGLKTWPARMEGRFRHLDSLATGLATHRVEQDEILIAILHFTKDNGELSSIALDEHTKIELL